MQDAAAEPGFWAIELLPRFLLNYDWTFNLFKDVCTAPYFHACGTCGMQAREAAASTVTERTIWGQVNHLLHYIHTLPCILASPFQDEILIADTRLRTGFTLFYWLRWEILDVTSLRKMVLWTPTYECME